MALGGHRDLRPAGVGAGLLQRQRQEAQQLGDLGGGGGLLAAAGAELGQKRGRIRAA
jgi:hypothetical protein